MSDDARASMATLPEPTDARFSMRAMLVVMAVVAALAALVGPLVRALDSDTQLRLLSAWSIWLIASVAWIGFLAWRRARVERLAGGTLLRLPMFDERISTASPWRRWSSIIASVIVSLFLLTPISGMAILPRRLLSVELIRLSIFSGLSIFMLGRAASLLWWRYSIRFCDSGILWDRQLVRWDHLLEHRWDQYDSKILIVHGIDQRGVEATWRVPVPSAELATVQALFDAKASRPSIPPGLPMSHLSTIPLSAAVRETNFFPLVGRILLIVALGIGISMLLSQARVSSQFTGSIMLGIIGALIVSNRMRFGMRRAGAPLVRIVANRRWLALVGFSAAAAGCYLAGYHYASMSPWLERGLGIGFGALAVMALQCLWPCQLDLRENGVSVPSRLVWPWSQVRVLTWDREGSGRLILMRGWRRVVAKVPPEQREVVDSVLREKLEPE